MALRDLDETSGGAVRVRVVLVGLMVLSAFLIAGMGLLAWIVGVWPGSILAGAGVVLVLCWAVELWGDEFRHRPWPHGGWGPTRDRIVPCDPTRAARLSADWFENVDMPTARGGMPSVEATRRNTWESPAPIPWLPSGRRWAVKSGRPAIAERRGAPLTGRRRPARSARSG